MPIKKPCTQDKKNRICKIASGRINKIDHSSCLSCFLCVVRRKKAFSKNSLRLLIANFLLFLAPSLAEALSYEVRFIGLSDTAALQSILDASQLVSLQHRPPASINGLRYRISADIPNLIQVLRAHAYYNASITSEIETIDHEFRVDIIINSGEQFKLQSYEVYNRNCNSIAEIFGCCPLTEEQLGLQIGSPALSTSIINAELQVLTELSRCGYPLASIEKRRVEVDMANFSVNAACCVKEGPLATFGPITLFGIKDIKPRFIEKKISWKEGEVYDTDLIQKTQERLLKTELFSSVLISHGEHLDETGALPIKMRITEAKHKKINLGAFYGTVDGFGGTISWTHRNIGGIGDIISLKADIAQKYYAGLVTYKKPDFLQFDQTYRALGEISQEKIYPYTAFMYRFANYIERQITPKQTVSAGLKIDHINVSHSAANGEYFLIGLPIFGKYDRSDNPINPTQGYTLTYSATPYQSLHHGNVHFVKQRFTATGYIPLTPAKKWILALRLQCGSIAGTKRENVPLPKLFLGGSEDELRGYRYKSVSPTIGSKPLGGRSAIFSSVELRIRMMKNVGIVPFMDFGTVTFHELPSVNAKWFKSVGVGLRYFAFFGPLRLDIGFPLDRREGIDHKFEIYASIGQAF